MDPLFKHLTLKFNDYGARGFLVKNLILDNELDLLLETKTDETKLLKNKRKKKPKEDIYRIDFPELGQFSSGSVDFELEIDSLDDYKYGEGSKDSEKIMKEIFKSKEIYIF